MLLETRYERILREWNERIKEKVLVIRHEASIIKRRKEENTIC